jgi:hypothetical protein
MSDEPKTIKVRLMVECEVGGTMDDGRLREIARRVVAGAVARDSGHRVGDACTFTRPGAWVLVRDPVELPEDAADPYLSAIADAVAETEWTEDCVLEITAACTVAITHRHGVRTVEIKDGGSRAERLPSKA